MKVSKAFTKYDKPFSQINVSVIKNLVAMARTDEIDYSSVNYDVKVLYPVAVEKLLEGVKIIHYEG